MAAARLRLVPAVPPPRSSPPSDLRRDLTIAGVIAAIVGIPLGIAGGLQWVDAGHVLRPEPPAPQWLRPDALRAMTRDGTLVKARVALEAGNSRSRSALRLRLRQINQLLNVSVLQYHREEISGADGLARLSTEMLTRVNRYLESEGVTPLRSIAITELVMTRA